MTSDARKMDTQHTHLQTTERGHGRTITGRSSPFLLLRARRAGEIPQFGLSWLPFPSVAACWAGSVLHFPPQLEPGSCKRP